MLTGLLVAHLLGALGAVELPRVVGESLYQAVMVGAAALCAARAACVAAERAAWLMLALGMGVWAGADLTFNALYGMDGAPPFPGLTDAMYIGSYLSLYAGVVLLLAARLRPFPRSLSLDGLIAGLTLSAFTAAFAFDAVLSSTDGPALTAIVTLAYPVADLLLVCFVGIALALTGWRPERTWALIALGFVLTAIADVTYAYSASAETYVAGGVTDTLWAASALAIALAAWQRGAPAKRVPDDVVAAVVPALFALAALALLICGWFVELPLAAGLLAMLDAHAVDDSRDAHAHVGHDERGRGPAPVFILEIEPARRLRRRRDGGAGHDEHRKPEDEACHQPRGQPFEREARESAPLPARKRIGPLRSASELCCARRQGKPIDRALDSLTVRHDVCPDVACS